MSHPRSRPRTPEPDFLGAAELEQAGLPDPARIVTRIRTHPMLGERMRWALLYALEGASYREAARAAGLGCHQDVAKTARRMGFAGLHRSRQVQRQRVARGVRDMGRIRGAVAGA